MRNLTSHIYKIDKAVVANGREKYSVYYNF